jgi:hypothetical protein
MQHTKTKTGQVTVSKSKTTNLKDLTEVLMQTFDQVRNNEIDYDKAGMIFNGAKTIGIIVRQRMAERQFVNGRYKIRELAEK